jgi:hypothetical protein
MHGNGAWRDNVGQPEGRSEAILDEIGVSTLVSLLEGGARARDKRSTSRAPVVKTWWEVVEVDRLTPLLRSGLLPICSLSSRIRSAPAGLIGTSIRGAGPIKTTHYAYPCGRSAT